MSKHTNRLAQETSPYLLQHAHNPVDWYPWGPEALERARKEDRPILLSIGYSACHWCHVMAHESFEDEAIGQLMNEHFVCIKVDREERPDLDEIYMTATVMMNHGQGGWPMTVFLTPDQKPFFAGTYFPPQDKHGRPGFGSILKHFGDLWKSDRARLVSQAGELTGLVTEQNAVAPGTGVGEAELDLFVESCARDFDPRFGGFGGAPKFPPSQSLLLLMRHHHRTGDAKSLDMVVKTLEGMADGGMYDHVGGGFARYSTDERWLVPHFEKMLYDNALLTRAYLEGFQITGDAKFARVAREVLDYVLREMTAPEGGFFSATDADSEGHEGKFFVWTPDEIEQVLGDEEARRFNTFYGITKHGNFEGKSIPHVTRSVEHVAKELGIQPDELSKSLAAARAKMYEARSRRVAPGLDDKVLTAWNGLMIGAMAEGYRVLGDARYLAAAEKAADFLLTTLAQGDGRLFRTWRAGKAHLNAYLEDYAYLAAALLDVYEAGGGARWLTEATRLCERILADFRDSSGGAFYNTAHGHEQLIVRTRTGTDGATPAGNAVAAHALARLAFHTDRADLRSAAEQAIEAYGRSMRQIPRAFSTTLLAVDLLLAGPVELAYVGARDQLAALERAVAPVYLPHRVIAHHDPATGPGAGPLLESRGPIDGKATLYVCRAGTCLAPVTDPAGVAQALRDPAARAGRVKSLGRALAGCATPDGTKAVSERWWGERPDGYGPLGTTGLTVSKLGFGGYRVTDEAPEHHAALSRALEEGVNLVDTSTNYANGGSERLVGVVVREVIARGKLRRDEVVLVSKIGYVQGDNLELARKRETAGAPFSDMVKYMDGCWHCIAPDWLADQLDRSLARLQVETLDVCLLHNPEYFFSDAKQRGQRDMDALRDRFYQRLEEAFRFFEAQVAAGRLKWYGVSSNTLGHPADDPEATSVTRILEAARKAGGDAHHCRVLQLPANLLESGAALEKNTGPGGTRTALEAAHAAGCGVLVNRPLNAFRNDGLMRLADREVPPPGRPLDQLVASVAALESEFKSTIGPHLAKLPAQLKPDRLAGFFSLGEALDGIWNRLVGLDHWEQIEDGNIMPQLSQVIRLLDRVLTGAVAAEWMNWRERYLPTLSALMAEIGRHAAQLSQDAANQVTARLKPVLPAERQAAPLSQGALWVLTSLPGVSCVLVGMRAVRYVDDATTVLAWPPLQDPARALSAMAGV